MENTKERDFPIAICGDLAGSTNPQWTATFHSLTNKKSDHCDGFLIDVFIRNQNEWEKTIFLL